MSEIPDIVAEDFAKIEQFIKWLRNEYVAPCEEDDYTDGCLSCDAGVAIKHMQRMLETMNPPTHNPEKEE